MAAANADAAAVGADADAGVVAGAGADADVGAVDGVDVVDAAVVAVSGFASSQKPVACTNNCRNLQFSILSLSLSISLFSHSFLLAHFKFKFSFSFLSFFFLLLWVCFMGGLSRVLPHKSID